MQFRLIAGDKLVYINTGGSHRQYVDLLTQRSQDHD